MTLAIMGITRRCTLRRRSGNIDGGSIRLASRARTDVGNVHAISRAVYGWSLRVSTDMRKS